MSNEDFEGHLLCFAEKRREDHERSRFQREHRLPSVVACRRLSYQ